MLTPLTGEVPDDLPVQSLVVGDNEAAAAILLATRTILTATSAEQVVAAVGRFVRMLGGRLVPAASDHGTALPLDVTLGVTAPMLPDAELLSVARMRLELFLPDLLEDARVAVGRLRHIGELEIAARVDLLTGLLSRRQFTRAAAGTKPGDAICFMDIDNFKLLNDSAGHDGGDEVLAALGRLIIGSIRPGDCAGRLGGDELALLLRDVEETVAVDRLRGMQARWLRSRPAEVTFSAGVCGVGPGGWQVALARADAAMYVAKSRGRNMIVAGEELQL